MKKRGLSAYTFIGIAYDRIRKSLSSCQKAYRKYRYISFTELKSCKKNDTVFIIGSGSSINKYSEEMRKEIRENDSFSFNFGMLYGINPTFHMFELNTREDGREIRDLLLHDVNVLHEHSPNTKIILKAGKKGKRIIDYISEDVLKNITLLCSYTMPVKSVQQLPASIKYIDKISNKTRKDNKTYICFTKRASIFTVLQICHDLGYKRIILCGIELNNDKYFYEQNIELIKSRGYLIPTITHNNGVHSTNDESIGKVTSQRLIEVYNDCILKRDGVELLLATDESALVSTLGVYWNKDDEKYIKANSQNRY